MELPLDVGNDTLKTAGILDVPPKAVAVSNDEFEVVAAQNGLLDTFGKLVPRGIHVKIELFGQAVQQVLEIAVQALTCLSPWPDGPLGDAQFCVTNHHVGVHRHGEPQTRTARTRTKG